MLQIPLYFRGGYITISVVKTDVKTAGFTYGGEDI